MPPGGHDVVRGARARQGKCMQRRRHECQQCRIHEIGALPAERLEQRVGGGPAHRRGEAAGKREHRDRLARLGAEDAPERRERRIVERGRHGGAEQHPHGEIGDRVARDGEPDESGCAGERAERHHAVAAVAIDQAADGRRDESCGQQPGREAAHREREGKSALRCDQRHRHDGRIEHRAPSQDLRDAEHGDGAPGADDEFAKGRHCAAGILESATLARSGTHAFMCARDQTKQLRKRGLANRGLQSLHKPTCTDVIPKFQIRPI